jgi:hypothetical protein
MGAFCTRRPSFATRHAMQPAVMLRSVSSRLRRASSFSKLRAQLRLRGSSKNAHGPRAARLQLSVWAGWRGRAGRRSRSLPEDSVGHFGGEGILLAQLPLGLGEKLLGDLYILWLLSINVCFLCAHLAEVIPKQPIPRSPGESEFRVTRRRGLARMRSWLGVGRSCSSETALVTA